MYDSFFVFFPFHKRNVFTVVTWKLISDSPHSTRRHDFSNVFTEVVVHPPSVLLIPSKSKRPKGSAKF